MNEEKKYLDEISAKQLIDSTKEYVQNEIDGIETLGIQYNESESALEFVGGSVITGSDSGSGGGTVANGSVKIGYVNLRIETWTLISPFTLSEVLEYLNNNVLVILQYGQSYYYPSTVREDYVIFRHNQTQELTLTDEGLTEISES